jgi:hypothetical protein
MFYVAAMRATHTAVRRVRTPAVEKLTLPVRVATKGVLLT